MKPDDLLNAIGEVDDACVRKAHRRSFLTAMLVFSVIVIVLCAIVVGQVPDFHLLLRYNPDGSVLTGFAEPEVLIHNKWSSMEYTAYADGEPVSTTRFRIALNPNYTITHTENGITTKIVGSNGDSVWPKDYLGSRDFTNLYLSAYYGKDLIDRIESVRIVSETAYDVPNEILNGYRIQYLERSNQILEQTRFENMHTDQEKAISIRGYSTQSMPDSRITGWQEWDPGWNLLAYAQYSYDGNMQTVSTYLADGTLTGTRVSKYTGGNLRWREYYDAEGCMVGKEVYRYRPWEILFCLEGFAVVFISMCLAATIAFAIWDDRIQIGIKLSNERSENKQKKTGKPFRIDKHTKRILVIFAVFIAVVIAAVLICAPLLESYDPGVEYHSGGYANTKGVLRGLCVGDLEEACGVVYMDDLDPTKPHSEYVDPELLDKFDSYIQLLDGRTYKHIAAADYALEGDYPDPPYKETCYMEITLEDGTMLYAIVVFRQEADGCGVTHFDLYTECPWRN